MVKCLDMWYVGFHLCACLRPLKCSAQACIILSAIELSENVKGTH